MSLPTFVTQAQGSWTGTMQLHQSWLPKDKQVSESVSKLHIDLHGKPDFATLTYRWSYDGKEHEGVMIICCSSKENQIAWVDTWHENSAILHTKGDAEKGDLIKTKGSYSAGKQVWGWTIDLKLDHDVLEISMDNVTPEGKADWAVKATYKRG